MNPIRNVNNIQNNYLLFFRTPSTSLPQAFFNFMTVLKRTTNKTLQDAYKNGHTIKERLGKRRGRRSKEQRWECQGHGTKPVSPLYMIEIFDLILQKCFLFRTNCLINISVQFFVSFHTRLSSIIKVAVTALKKVLIELMILVVDL